MQVDVLVNNGGRSQRAWIHDTALQVDQDMVNLNVLGQISLTKMVLPYMRQRKSGLIMVNSSVTGKMGGPLLNFQILCSQGLNITAGIKQHWDIICLQNLEGKAALISESCVCIHVHFL